MRLGIIARSDNTGLGNQTRELVNMLNPDKILLIDSAPFNKNKQHPEWYEGYNLYSTRGGMPTTKEIIWFLKDVDVVISCETFYHLDLVDLARQQGTKTILQYNYELFGNLTNPNWSLPDVLLSPSLWNIDIVKERFGSACDVIHLPPPTNESLFNKAKDNNLLKDHNRILHIAGKKAAKDRNGTESIFEMVKHSKEDYELVIKSQTPLDTNCKDSRVKIEIGNPASREDMYDGFDAMILPRRYAGLCLPMNESLISALPVFMTDISPNNQVLPSRWLAPSHKELVLNAKTKINVYGAEPKRLARLLDEYMALSNNEKTIEKNNAFNTRK
jgi:hypothetical protein